MKEWLGYRDFPTQYGLALRKPMYLACVIPERLSPHKTRFTLGRHPDPKIKVWLSGVYIEADESKTPITVLTKSWDPNNKITLNLKDEKATEELIKKHCIEMFSKVEESTKIKPMPVKEQMDYVEERLKQYTKLVSKTKVVGNTIMVDFTFGGKTRITFANEWIRIGMHCRSGGMQDFLLKYFFDKEFKDGIKRAYNDTEWHKNPDTCAKKSKEFNTWLENVYYPNVINKKG